MADNDPVCGVDIAHGRRDFSVFSLAVDSDIARCLFSSEQGEIDGYRGADWVISQGWPISPFGKRVADLLGVLCRGIYHLGSDKLSDVDFSRDNFISVVVDDGNGRFSTCDADMLTRFVLLCHLMKIRGTIKAHTHGYFRLIFADVKLGAFIIDDHPSLTVSINNLEVV